MTRYDPEAWPQHFGVYHRLLFVYLFFAGYADGDLDKRESRAIADALEDWGYTFTGNELTETMEFLSEHADGPIEVYFAYVCGLLRDSMSIEERRRIVEDLAKIAKADGRVVPDEKFMLNIMKQRLDL